MLKTLFIQNYALIENLTVEFEQGLNIITGETGAGKSIIIDALGSILGERADADAVRKGTEKAIVEAVFSVSQHKVLKKILGDNEIECGDEVILRREVSVKGQSRCFINDTPATLALLKQTGDVLIDLHGQHEHQSLLRAETHIDMLDDFGGLEGLTKEFSVEYSNVIRLRRELDELRSKENQSKEKLELYQFQMNEIDAVSPQPDDETSLGRELSILENSEKLFSITEQLYRTLYEGDAALHDKLVFVRNQLEDLTSIDPSFEESKNEAASASAIVGELAKFIQQYNSRIEFNPERLEAIRNRLGQIALLKKKYGGSFEALIAHREKIGKEVALAENFDAEIASRRKQLEAERSVCSEIAQRLSSKRREVAKKVNKAVEKTLAELGIANAVFDITVENVSSDDDAGIVKLGKKSYETSAKGIDRVEFFISTNIGEDPKPLVKIASGGEISRVMLALKTILAKSDRLPLLIFDEIDVGVSGRIAQAVGQSIKKLTQFHQVIAITHLPQIAGLGDTHFAVEKRESAKRSFTTMKKLSLDERVTEVAKLMSGEEITTAGLQGARELMGIE